jgi:peptide deformylase
VIVLHPSPVLSTPAQVVDQFDDKLAELAHTMTEVCAEHYGAGLAAPQIGVLLRLAVVMLDHPALILVNPRIVRAWGRVSSVEGCLSIPGVVLPVQRYSHVVVGAQRLDGETFTVRAWGRLAVCIQHEIDHLNGVTILERARRP